MWFEAVVVLRLDVSPLKNFFHPIDMLHRGEIGTATTSRMDEGKRGGKGGSLESIKKSRRSKSPASPTSTAASGEAPSTPSPRSTASNRRGLEDPYQSQKQRQETQQPQLRKMKSATDLFDVADLSLFGLCSRPITESSVSLCWLTSHHVPFDSSVIQSLLRLSQSEVINHKKNNK